MKTSGIRTVVVKGSRTIAGLRVVGLIVVALCGGLAASGMTGCVASGSAMPENNKQAILGQIRDGRAYLDCGFLCSASFIFRQRSFLELYRQQRWEDLALAVMAVRWRQDLTYFYLGTAAEGLKYYDAADRYYRMAGYLSSAQNPDINDKCASVQNLCAGFSFPRDISNRLRELAKERQAAVASNMADARLAPAITGQGGALSSDAYENAVFIADAPQTLLVQYISDRFKGQFNSGVPGRETNFANQALEALNPPGARQSQGNEIFRPQQIYQLRERLLKTVPADRMALGMYVQLTDYDMRSYSFTVRYPIFYSASTLNLGGSAFRGQSQRNAGVQGYSAGGTTCVWEPSQGYPRGDLGSAFFVVLTACIQHPPPGAGLTSFQAANNEIPPAIALVPPQGSLWSRFSTDPGSAQRLITKMGPNRLMWAELVFDLLDISQSYGGPYSQQTLQTQKMPPLVAKIKPLGLFLWDTSAQTPRSPFAALGATHNWTSAAGGRLTQKIIFDTEPQPKTSVVWGNAAASPTTPAVPTVVRDDAGKKGSDDGDWIVPPPAKQ